MHQSYIHVELYHMKALLRRMSTYGKQKFSELELNLFNFLEETKQNVRTALMDDFDTPKALGIYLFKRVEVRIIFIH